MKYGLIGEKLSHSFSKIIHEQIAPYTYELVEVPQADLAHFMRQKAFEAINVTIPYKQAVMAFLDEIDPVAAAIGAVNTVVNTGGKLKGYNTDYLGLQALIQKHHCSLQGKTVLILGSGGTSLTAKKVAEDMGAAEVLRVSRHPQGATVSYEQAYRDYAHCDVIINTTPVGMYPHTEEQPLDLKPFGKAQAVFDVIYNPLRTNLVLNAGQQGMLAEGGLYMLVAQAVYASEYFLNTQYDAALFEQVYQHVLMSRRHLVLEGMPGSGKSTVGKLLAEQLGKPFIDTDAWVEQKAGMSIPEMFQKQGEAAFRRMESEVIREALSETTGAVIALGGGAVLNPDNVLRLKQNGCIYFLNRDIEQIVPTADRPLALDRAALQKRYEERFDIYTAAADTIIPVNGDAASVAAQIRKDYCFES